MKKLAFVIASLIIFLGLLPVYVASGAPLLGSLATETGDWAYPNAPTFTAILGSQTVTGNLGPTPTDGQDPFNVNIPSTLEVTSVAYSGPAGPHNLVGCGLTGVSNLNQSFSSSNSGCQLSWFINTNFAESASAWTVTIVTQNAPVPTDTQAPIWTVQNATASTSNPGGTTVAYTANASDNVGVTSSSCSPASGSNFPIGTTTVNCTASDAAGNVGTASLTVTVSFIDTIAPTITCPANITVGNDVGQASAVVTYSAPTTSDNVGVASFIQSAGLPSGASFPIGTTTNSFISSDAAGNTASCSFSVTVNDTEPPVLTVPADITVEATGPSGATVNYSAGATDAVGVTSQTCVPAFNSTFPIGTTSVNCTATDQAGNVGTASFNITVQDTTAPTWTVPADITVEATGPSGATINYVATPSDVVGVTSQSCTPASGSTFPIGTTAVNCTASDAASNTGNASFNVIVQDTTAPTWTVPADITVVATSLAGAPVNFTATPSDAVGVASSSCTPASGSTFALATTAVNCTASDAAGNTDNASFNVTVEVNAGSVDTLEAGIEGMGLPNGVENSLTGPLQQATKLLNDNKPGNDGAVCDKLAEFLLHVQDKLATGDITQAQADSLTSFAQAIQSAQGCP